MDPKLELMEALMESMDPTMKEQGLVEMSSSTPSPPGVWARVLGDKDTSLEEDRAGPQGSIYQGVGFGGDGSALSGYDDGLQGVILVEIQ